MSVENKIDKLIEEGLLDLVKRNPGKTAVATGALGYSLGTGAAQKGAKYVMNTPPKDMISDAKDSVKSVWDSVENTTADDIASKVGSMADKISNAIH